MEQSFILILVGLTSVGGCLAGRKALGLSWAALRMAVGKMLRCVGIMLAFFAANLAAGLTVILAVRSLTPGFLSVYLVDDVVLLVLSLLQGVTFQWWLDSKARGG